MAEEKWHYIKDGVLPNTELGRAHVTVAYINAYENPCGMDCCFDGTNFVYWDYKSSVGWRNVDIFWEDLRLEISRRTSTNSK